MTNQLHLETSPYLLQHANNPVFWQAWNTKTLNHAMQNNLLLIVSIGYSACHWCHVMEHESFENQEVASQMNHGFVNIKIDREERPDVDAVYMKAIQIMTSQGGWPLNVVCLPDGRPVWGGTFFRKQEWIESLGQLRELYENQPEKMIEYAEKLHKGIQTISLIESNDVFETKNFDQNILENLVSKWQKSFDFDFGGMARAPKFMMPNNYLFLQRYAHFCENQNLMDFVDLTLTKMAFGGIFDVVDGGFSRYSVDLKWHVPHFEKMLYDNGQLISLYAQAYKRSKNVLYKNVVFKTVNFIKNALTSPEGAFFCALDADSLNHESKLEEGAFYVWTKPELQQILQLDFALFSEVYNINSFGHWENEHYVLIQTQSLEAVANKNNITTEALQNKVVFWNKKLFVEREKRPKPRLDDKCLTSWNAILSKGLLEAYEAFGEIEFLEMALKNLNFLVKNVWHEDGFLFRNYKNKTATIEGFLEDYAHLIAAMIAAHQTTLNSNWLHHAKQLTDFCLAHFFDQTTGFFAFNSNRETVLLAPHFEIEDNVIPASNSVMAQNLQTLALLFENDFYDKIANQMLQHIMQEIDYPSAFSNWLNVYLNTNPSQKQMGIVGKNALDFVFETNKNFSSNAMVFGAIDKVEIPFLKNKFSANETLFFVCENKTCSLPNTNFQEFLKKL